MAITIGHQTTELTIVVPTTLLGTLVALGVIQCSAIHIATIISLFVVIKSTLFSISAPGMLSSLELESAASLFRIPLRGHQITKRRL